MSLPYFVPGILPGGERRDLETLETLVSDLRSYACGRLPSADELAFAPVVSDWFATLDGSARCLAGLVDGHPLVGPGPGTTSRIYAVDRSHRWMRS